MLTNPAWRASIPRSPLQGELPKAEGVPLPIDYAPNRPSGCSLPHVNRPEPVLWETGPLSLWKREATIKRNSIICAPVSCFSCWQ